MRFACPRWAVFCAPLAIGFLWLPVARAEDSGPKAVEEQALYFSLPATNSYKASVSIHSPSGRLEEPAFVDLVLSRPGQSALYSVKGRRIGTHVQASFGKLGTLDLTYAISDRPSEPESVSLVGLFQFRGEHGYTHVSANSIRGTTSAPRPQPSVISVRRARRSDLGDRVLEARYRGPRDSLIFDSSMSSTDRTSAKPEFIALALESRKSIEIIRVASGTGAKSALRISGAGDSEISVYPPSPFSGEATLTREPGEEPAWNGNLVAAFPGRKPVRMAGARFKARLISPQALASAFAQTHAEFGNTNTSASDVPSAAEEGASWDFRSPAPRREVRGGLGQFLLPRSPLSLISAGTT